MKLNYIGIVAGILAFISLALPWWTFTMSGTEPISGYTMRMDISIYLYEGKMTEETNGYKVSTSAPIDLWYADATLALVVIAGIAGIVGSLIIGKTGKMILVVAGILALLSIVIFAAGLQSDLPELSEFTGLNIGLFSSGSILGVVDYLSYLSFGFWLALVAAIIAFISLGKHPMALPEAPPTPAAEIKRFCPKCGRVIKEDVKFCPHCGQALES